MSKYLGDNVKKYMDQRGLKQFELAKLAHVSITTISNLINGKKTPTINCLEKVAKVLGKTVSDLLKFKD